MKVSFMRRTKNGSIVKSDIYLVYFLILKIVQIILKSTKYHQITI